MATLFGSDPDLATESSSMLAATRDQIEPVAQWLGDPEALGVPEIVTAVSGFKDAASSATEQLADRVDGAAKALGSLASGTRELDQSLADRLGLPSPEPAGGSAGGEPGAQIGPGQQLALANKYLTLPPKPMLPRYQGENMPSYDRPAPIRYLSDSERQEYQLTVRDGLLYDADGDLFDTREVRSEWSYAGRAKFVVDPETGNIYASTSEEQGLFKHSSFLGGKAVAGAGTLTVIDGKLVAISDDSGHYAPTEGYTKQVVQYFKALGIDTDDVRNDRTPHF